MKLFTFFEGALTQGIAITQTQNGLVVELGNEEGKKIPFPVSVTNPPEITDGRVMRASLDLEASRWHLVEETDADKDFAFLHLITWVNHPRQSTFKDLGRWYVMRGSPLTLIKKNGDSWDGLIRFRPEERIELQLIDCSYFAIECIDGELLSEELPD